MKEQSVIRKTSQHNNNKSPQLTTGSTLLNDKYMLSQLIGKGSFGQVYRGVFVEVKEESVKKYPKYAAIKVQNDLSKVSQISNQITVLNNINKHNKLNEGFPKLYASGIQNGRAFMVMDLLGPNLQDLMLLCGGKFSLKTALILTIQILQRVEIVHEIGYVYRDIKPENFLMGLGKFSTDVFMVDFGLCKRYRDFNTKLFVPYKESVSMVGTIRYSSVNSHLGIDQTRRDDLQSIIYLLIYFVKGQLPWQGLGSEHQFEKDHMIMDCKLKITVEELCKQLPSEVQNAFQYIKNLDFYQQPDYHYIMSQLSYILHETGGSQDYTYDWEGLQNQLRLQKTNIDIVVPTDHKIQNQMQGKMQDMEAMQAMQAMQAMNQALVTKQKNRKEGRSSRFNND